MFFSEPQSEQKYLTGSRNGEEAMHFSRHRHFLLVEAGTVFPESEPHVEPLGYFSHSQPQLELEPIYLLET